MSSAHKAVKYGWSARSGTVMGAAAIALTLFYVRSNSPSAPSQIDTAPIDNNGTPRPASKGPITKVSDGDGATSQSAKLARALAARYRLTAERDGTSYIKLPEGFNVLAWNAKAILAGEQRLFEARRQSFESQQRHLRLRVKTVFEEIEGFEAQRNAKEEEIGLIRQELGLVEGMHKRELVNTPRLLNLKRELTRARWDVGSLDAAVARSRLTIRELEQNIHEMRHNVIVDAEREIRDIDLEIGQLVEADDGIPRSLAALAQELRKGQDRRGPLQTTKYSKN